MATERIIDLANQRYADRPYEGPLPVAAWPEERERQLRQENALELLKLRLLGSGPDLLDRTDLRNILTVLGVL